MRHVIVESNLIEGLRCGRMVSVSVLGDDGGGGGENEDSNKDGQGEVTALLSLLVLLAMVGMPVPATSSSGPLTSASVWGWVSGVVMMF